MQTSRLFVGTCIKQSSGLVYFTIVLAVLSAALVGRVTPSIFLTC